MAKRDDKENQPTRRVYKSSDVHKRRVGDSSRSKPAKMPSKREARESARESTRITAESRAGKTGRIEPVAEEETQRPRFTVIKSKSQSTQTPVEARTSAPATQSPETPVGARTSAPVPSQTLERPRINAPAADAEGGAAEPEQSEQSAQKPRRRAVADVASQLPRLRPRTIVIAVVMVIAVVAVCVFAFNRWGRFDDHADMQGTWYVLGTEVAIEIGDDTIKLNDEVSYHYQIDERQKTITYTFGPMSGQGRYWFSDDRKHLVITDGDDYTAASTTVDDLIHAFLDFSTATGGGVVELPQGEGIIAFSREPEGIYTNLPAEGLVVEQPQDETQAEGQSAEEAPAEEAPAEGAPAEEAPTEEAPTEEAPAEDQPAEETPAAEQPTNEEEAA